MKRILFCFIPILLFAACDGTRNTYIPDAPDYTDSAMWFTAEEDATGSGADIFYVVSTWEKDWQHDGTVCHYADVWNPEHRAHMAIEIGRIASYMAPGNRFYAPYYRHTTIDGWATKSERTIRRRTRLSMEDVCTAFDCFLAQRDNSRPLIIAGFSQGGMAVVELLKHMNDETYSQLAAAYVMGYKLTPSDTLCAHIRPAKGATDTGVTICYNTVKDVKYVQPVIAATCCGINPVNWHTDATPAVLHDTITVTLDPKAHVLVVSGYSGSEYPPYADLINVGDIHSCEPWLYSDCIRQNIETRIEQFKQSREENLKNRAFELCAYIPDHELLERSRDFMTADFYAVLDTMFYRLPEHEAMDHEWLYYFVTGNGGSIADYEVKAVRQTDATHAEATILVRQKWEDGSFANSDIEEHQLSMERVNGAWLLSDFDGHKADCIRYIANNRKEQALREAISDYLVREIGSQYAQGDICVPTLMMVHETDTEVYGDFWIFWYKTAGDTLKTVSGGNHSGKMTISMRDNKPVVTAFEQTTDGAGFERSAKRIFGKHYDIYQNMHSNEAVREAVRKEQLEEYVKRQALTVKYYQDYGWPAVPLD